MAILAGISGLAKAKDAHCFDVRPPTRGVGFLTEKILSQFSGDCR
jgi:hypothetical protein